MSIRWPLYFVAALLCLGTSNHGFAQSRAAGAHAEPEGYREAIDRALEEMQLSNFAEAREQFARAHRLFPNARTLRGLGMSEFELRHYLSAAENLEQALSTDVRPLEGKLRQETAALLERAQAYIGELRITLSPSDAKLVIDGTRTVARVGGPIRFEVGDHVLEFRARGHATERRQVNIRGGQTEALQVELAALNSAESAQQPRAEAVPAREDRREEPTPTYKRWWPWTILGVVVAGAAAGTYFALSARDGKTEYRSVDSANTPVGAGLQPLRVR